MPTITSLVNPSAGKVFSGIAGASAGGQEFGAELLSGFRQGFGAAFNAGATLSQTMLGGFLAPLGQSGQAITRAAGAITNAVGGVFDTLLSGATSLVSFGGKMTSMLGGALLAGIGGAVGFIAGPTGAMLGATIGAALGGILGKALGSIGEFFGNIVSTAGEALGKVAGLLGELGSSLASLLGDVLKTAEDTGRSILKLQGAGYSAKDAGNLVQTVKFFGIDPGKLADKWSKPGSVMSMGSRAAAMNVPRPDLDFGGFITKFTADFEAAKKAGAQSLAIFKSKAMETGFGDFLATAELGSKRVATMLKVSQAFQVDGAKVGELGDDVAMANNILGGLATQLKLVFAETLLPLLPMISQGFSYIVQNKDAIAGAIQTAGTWLVNELPPMVLRGAAGVLEAVSGLLGGFASFATGLSANLDAILTQADAFLNGLRTFGGVLAGIGASIAQGITNLLPGAASILPTGTSATPTPAGAPTSGTPNSGGAPSQGSQTSPLNPARSASMVPLTPHLPIDPDLNPLTPPKLGKSLGGWKTRLAAAFAGAGAGAWAGGAAGQAVGTGVGAVAGGIAGLGAGGIGAVPGAVAGAGMGASIGRFVGTVGGALVGAYKGWKAANYVQTQYGDPMVYGTPAPGSAGAGQAAANTSPGAAPSAPSNRTPTGTGPGKTNTPAASVPNAPGSFLPIKGRSMGDAYAAGQATFLNAFGPSNLAGNPEFKADTQRALQKAIKFSTNASNTAHNWSKSLETDADNWPKLMVKELQKLNATTEKNGKKDGGGIDMGAVSAAGLAQIGAYIAQDAARLSARG